MYIVGTSGHIDHGKTSLIRSLTGIDCDRLPEEKERAMTIDIGFASIDIPKLGTVSIIDVPGHERFIRNMVVGAWGIDLALLIVAVDDGWMPQTEDHFRVLQMLGIEYLIVVLNKIDTADEEMIAFVEEEVIEKTTGTRFEGSPVIKASAKTGDGMEELKQEIVSTLKKVPKAADAKKPYMFVDRIFASKGYGTVITGTLKNGFLAENDEVKILPLKTTSRIKRIESHFSENKEANPSQRTALNITGVNKDDLHRGFIILKGDFFLETTTSVVKIQLLPDKKIKNNSIIEILIGTASIRGKVILLESGTADEQKNNFTARIKLNEPWFLYPGQPFVLANPGGYRIIGGGTVLLADYSRVTDKKALKEALKVFTKYNRTEILLFQITCFRYILKSQLLSIFPDADRVLEKDINELIENNLVTELSDILISTEYYKKAADKLTASVNSGVGLNLKEISDLSEVDPEPAKIILQRLMQENPIIEKDGRYFASDSITEETLSPEKKSLLEKILKNGIEGIEMDKINNEKIKKEAKDLIKLGFLVSLDGNIVYHKQTYEELKDKVMQLLESAPKISIPEAKDATALSRKYIIPLLTRIESDGLIKRIGDFRMKA